MSNPVSPFLIPEVQAFLQKNEQADTHELLFSQKEVAGIPMRDIVAQLLARRKAKVKIPEWYEASQVIYPPLLSLEQCSSALTARFKGEIVTGGSLLDLTGGMGVDTYYLAQHFDSSHYVEKCATLTEIAVHNFQILKANHIHCHNGDAIGYLNGLTRKVDWIYLDPARRDKADKKVFRLEDCEPNLIEMMPTLLEKGKDILVKTAPLLDIVLALKTLKKVAKVYVVAVHNECKEVLYHLSNDAMNPPEIITVNFTRTGAQEDFYFDLQLERAATVSYHLPQTYLYEPNSAILKAGAFKSIALAYGLHKLHQHSHLYTSTEPKTGFPGRCFRIIKTLRYNRKVIKAALPQGKANITVRNFPVGISEIRKKTGLKEGGDAYLFATTDLQGQKVMLLCERV